MSIKWKLTLALIATGLTLVTTYVYLAKRVFESDKISYVFDTQNSRIASMKREIEQRFERALIISRSIVASFEPSKGTLTKAGDQIFDEEKSMLALEVWNEKTDHTFFRVDKKSGVLPPAEREEQTFPVNELRVLALKGQKFLILLRYQLPGNHLPLRLRAVIEANDLLPQGETHLSLALLQNGRVVSGIESDSGTIRIFEKLAQEIPNDKKDRTMMWGRGPERFLVSVANIGVGDLKIVAMTPEEVALGALGTLFRRSLIFLAFSTFGLIAVSLTLARGLTGNLRTLTSAAKKIGQGEFDQIPSIRTQDEMGVLSNAFTQMSHEIQRLLVETSDKARMEAELRTASLVQERLLPVKSTATFGELEINGKVVTSTECGGDWWYYFQKGDDLYVAIADATGHGTPAALITAAARSIFSRLETENLSLAEMMRAWDLAISSCSLRHVFMTGMIFRINTKTGEGSYLNAGHEPPYLLTPVDTTFESHFLELDMHESLGEGFATDLQEQHFVLPRNASLVLYTDGLFSVTFPDGKRLSDKRFGTSIAVNADRTKNAADVTNLVLEKFDEYRQDQRVPDDVTVVTIRRATLDAVSSRDKASSPAL